MSDFDEVLERLLTDATFQGVLAADPRRALAGYQLTAEERELLNVQLVMGAGEDRSVETRTSKSGVVGLLGPVAAAFGAASGVSAGNQSLGMAPSGATFGEAPHVSGVESFGGAAESPGQTFGAAVPPSGSTQSLGAAADNASMGSAMDNASMGSAADNANFGSAPVEATDYHTRVDVDGDGSWDAYKAYERADGGVDIQVDVDRDGVVDFVGHDIDRDGLVDSAEFDTDLDGVLDTRMFDDSGDGWMDRSEQLPAGEGQGQSFGQAPG